MNDISAYLNSLFDGITAHWETILGSGLTLLLLTILYGRAEAWWNRRRERIGLLRVIDAEVYENNEVLKEMISDPDLSEQYPSRAALSVDAWDQSRTRLVQLLRTAHFKSLVTHYAAIRRIAATLADRDVKMQGKSKADKQKAANIREKRHVLLSSLANLAWLVGEQIRKKGKRYIGTPPDYFVTAEREAEQAAAANLQADGEDVHTEITSPV